MTYTIIPFQHLTCVRLAGDEPDDDVVVEMVASLTRLKELDLSYNDIGNKVSIISPNKATALRPQ